MLDAKVTGRIAQKVAEEAAKAAEQQKLADAGDVERFEQALSEQTPSSTGAEAESAAPGAVSDAAPGTPADTPQSLGDSILEGIERLRTQHADTMAQVEEALSGEEAKKLTPEELLKIQLAVTQLTVQQDVTAKVASKATQSVETLLRSS